MCKIYKSTLFLLSVTIVLTLSSCSGFFIGSFQGKKYVKKSGDNYVELSDGSIIRGEKIKWGRLFSNAVIIDDQKFKASEVKGFQDNGIYWLYTTKGFLERMVAGKITVLKATETHADVSTVGGNMRTSTHTDIIYFMKHENEEKLIRIKKNDDIKNAISTCPKALAMMELSNKQLRRAIKENPAYMNQVFETYNNDCKEPEGKKRINW